MQHVFSVAPASEWPKIYDGLDLERVGLSRVLTGYLDEHTLARTQRILGEGRERTIDIGYRTVPGKPYLGRHAILKAEIAEVVRERAEARGLRVDISTRAEDTFYGDDWYRFLASCRYTIGMEGGASILDRDGSVRACVESRLEEKPAAGFSELEAACFPGRDGELELYAISPRHLEACATRTAQILVEGDYGGILRPGTHYSPLRRDLSNLDAVLDVVAERPDHATEIADNAYRDVVASGQYTYRRLVEEVERELPSPAPAGRHRLTARASGAVDAVSRPLIPLATSDADAGTDDGCWARAALRAIARVAAARGSRRKRVGGVLVIYDRPITPFHRDASTVVEHATSFAEHSRLGAVQVNADAGFPAGLDELEFDAVILHYSLFGMARYRLDEGFLRYLKETGAYKVAFFQDEYFACQRRFAFLNEYEIDCVYTCLEPDQFDQVYGRYTGVPQLRVDAHRLCERPPPGRRRAVRQARLAASRGCGLPGSAAARLPRPRCTGEDPDRRALRRAGRRQRAAARHRGRRGGPALRRRLVPLPGRLPLSSRGRVGRLRVRPGGRGIRGVRPAARRRPRRQRRRPDLAGALGPRGRPAHDQPAAFRGGRLPGLPGALRGPLRGRDGADAPLHPAGARTSRTSTRCCG